MTSTHAMQPHRHSHQSQQQRAHHLAAHTIHTCVHHPTRWQKTPMPPLALRHPSLTSLTSLTPVAHHSPLPACPQGTMAGPSAMLASRRQRHKAAWQAYCGARDGLTAGLQRSAAQLAAQLKALLDADDEEVEQQLGRLADDVVMELSEQGIMQVGRCSRSRCACGLLLTGWPC
jgi:hypothetical protein